MKLIEITKGIEPADPTRQSRKPLAGISLDLDNQWSYMKIHGDKGWEKYRSDFDRFIPDVLDLVDELQKKTAMKYMKIPNRT